MRLLVGAQTLSLLGGNVHAAGVAWLMLQQGGSSWLGWFAIARFAPGAVAVGLLAKRLDRSDRRIASVVVYVSQALLGMLFWLLWITTSPTLPMFVAYLSVYSCLAAMDGASFASLLSVTGGTRASEWVANMSMFGRLAGVAGMLLAGPLVSWNPAAAVGANAVSFIPAALACWRYGEGGKRAHRTAAAEAGWPDAFRELRSAAGGMTLAAATAFAVFAFLPSVLGPLAAALTGWGPVGLSAVTAAMTSGAAFTSVLLRKRALTATITASGSLLCGVGLLLLGSGDAWSLAGAFLFSAAGSCLLLHMSRCAVTVREHVRGRAVALWQTTVNASAAGAAPIALAWNSIGKQGPFLWCALWAFGAGVGLTSVAVQQHSQERIGITTDTTGSGALEVNVTGANGPE